MKADLFFLILYSALGLVFFACLLKYHWDLIKNSKERLSAFGGISVSTAGLVLCLFGALDPKIQYSNVMMNLWICLFWTGCAYSFGCASAELKRAASAEDNLVKLKSQQASYFQIVLSTVLIFALPFVIFQSAAYHGQGLQKTSPRPSESNGVYEFPQFNLKYIQPEGPWLEMSADALSAVTLKAFFRTNPTVYFQIIAEEGLNVKPGIENQFADQIYAETISKLDKHKLIEKKEIEIAGIKGQIFTSEVAFKAVHINRIHWLGGKNGFYYQFVSWAPLNVPLETLENTFREAVQGASMLDPDKKVAAKTVEEDYVSASYHYKVNAKDKGWDQWWLPAMEDYQVPDYRIIHGTDETLWVFPLAFWEKPPPLSILAPALLKFNKLEFSRLETNQIREIKNGTYEGYEINCKNDSDGQHYQYRIKILRGEKFAYYITAHASDSNGNIDAALLEQARNMVEILEPGVLPERGSLSKNEISRYVFAYLQIGEEYFQQGNKEEQLRYLKMAHSLEPENVSVFETVLKAFLTSEEYDAGFQYADKHIAKFQDNVNIEKMYAKISGLSGEWAKGAEIYEKLIAKGYVDSEILEGYVELMTNMKKEAKAYEKLNALIGVGSDRSAQIQFADFLSEHEKNQESFDLYKRLYEKFPHDADIRHEYFVHFMKKERYEECVQAIDRHIEKYGMTSDVVFYRGYALTALERYDEARMDFGKAQQLSPDSEAVKEMLDGLAMISNQKKGKVNGMNTLEIKRTLTVAGADVIVTENLKWSGYWGEKMEENLESGSEEKMMRDMQRNLNAVHGTTVADDIKIIDSETGGEPFEIRLKYTVPDAFQKFGKGFLLTAYQYWEGLYLWPRGSDEYSIPTFILYPGKVLTETKVIYPQAFQLDMSLTSGHMQIDKSCIKTQTDVTQNPGDVHVVTRYEIRGGAYTEKAFNICQEEISDSIEASVPRLLFTQ